MVEELKTELSGILDKLSGILDMAYEHSEDQDEKVYICEVEDNLHNCLRKLGVLD